MGVFDYIRCKYPVPGVSADDYRYQTKDTPSQFLDHYEIAEDGRLFFEAYDTEDRSEAGLWRKEHPGEPLPDELLGLSSLIGCATRVNTRLQPMANFTGEIVFYDDKDCWSAYFVNGLLSQMHCVTDETPATP